MGLKGLSGLPSNLDFRTPNFVDNEISIKENIISNTAQSIGVREDANRSIGSYNRQKLEQAFSQNNQTEQTNREINGVGENTPFMRGVEVNESQESVLRGAYEAYADKAGLSDESKKLFVEERLAANKQENKGENRIFNPETGQAYSDTEWLKFQEQGAIIMKPTAEDVELLKTFKGSDDYKAGEAAADRAIAALKLGASDPLTKLAAPKDASSELAAALNKVKEQSESPEFQRGFIDKLGAGNFLKLEQMLSDNSRYKTTMQASLSTAGKSEVISDASAETQKQIAQKADAETLARLTSNEARPMSTNFLIEAGKRVSTPEVGWKTVVLATPSGEAVQQEGVSRGTAEVLAAIARSPEASAELLQDEAFVKNNLRMGNMSDRNAGEGFAQVLRAGTSATARQSDARAVENAIMTVSQSLGDREYLSPDGTINQNQTLLGLKDNQINANIANAMIDAYENNIDLFSGATSQASNKPDSFNAENVRDFIGAIQPHYNVKDPTTGVSYEDRMTIATAKRFINLLKQAESTGDASYATEAANLTGTFIDGNARASLEGAKEKDARQEKLSKALAILGEVATFYSAKGITEIAADIAGKSVAGVTEIGGKGSHTDDVAEMNRNRVNNQQDTNTLVLIQVHEQAAYERANSVKPPVTKEEEKKKEQAVQFLTDLKTYNDSLPPNEKILDAKGRLINPLNMNGNQQKRVTNIFGEGTGLDYRKRLGDQMRDTYERLANTTERQIH